MKVTRAIALTDYHLELHFENGETGTVDMSEFVGKGVCAAWENTSVFEQVAVTTEGAVAWPGDIDFCADALYLRMTGQPPEAIFPAIEQRASHA